MMQCTYFLRSLPGFFCCKELYESDLGAFFTESYGQYHLMRLSDVPQGRGVIPLCLRSGNKAGTLLLSLSRSACRK